MRWISAIVAALGAAAGALVARAISRREGSVSGELDAYAPRELTQAGECDPTPKPGPLAFRELVRKKFGERAGSPQNITRDCALGSPSEHWQGRAWDWMIPDAASAEKMIAWLFAPDEQGRPHAIARRAGIMFAIYNRRMWRAYEHGAETRVWAPYTGPNPHTDHVHVSFSWAGARGETSLYRGGGGALVS